MIVEYRKSSNTSIFDTDSNAGIGRTCLTANSVEQNLLVENYRGTNGISLRIQHAGGPPPDERAVFTTFIRSDTF